jgi:hypothetical protein
MGTPTVQQRDARTPGDGECKYEAMPRHIAPCAYARPCNRRRCGQGVGGTAKVCNVGSNAPVLANCHSHQLCELAARHSSGIVQNVHRFLHKRATVGVHQGSVRTRSHRKETNDGVGGACGNMRGCGCVCRGGGVGLRKARHRTCARPGTPVRTAQTSGPAWRGCQARPCGSPACVPPPPTRR